MTVYIVPLNSKKLNVNQYKIGFHSLLNRFQFDWNESYDAQDFMGYFKDLQPDQAFLVFKTKDEALKYAKSNEGIEPGYLVTIRSRVPIYEAELQTEFDDIPINEHQQKHISKSDVKRLLSASLQLNDSECNFEKEQQEKAEFDANIEILKGYASNPLLNPKVKNSLNAVIECIQKPEYKSLEFSEKRIITQQTILFIKGEITLEEYKNVIQKDYLGYQSSPALKYLGAALMLLAIAVSACMLVAGGTVTAAVLVGAGLGLYGYSFFAEGQGAGVSKPLHEVLDAQTEFASLNAMG